MTSENNSDQDLTEEEFLEIVEIASAAFPGKVRIMSGDEFQEFLREKMEENKKRYERITGSRKRE